MFHSMCTYLYVMAVRATELPAGRIRRRLDGYDERGQASAEYALVLMAAAGLAILFGSWAVKSGNVSKIFENVLSSILGDMSK